MFFLPARSRKFKRVVYLEGYWDVFHVGYVDIINDIVKQEVAEMSGEFHTDVFLILGILSSRSCLQSLHEIALHQVGIVNCFETLLFHGTDMCVQRHVGETLCTV